MKSRLGAGFLTRLLAENPFFRGALMRLRRRAVAGPSKTHGMSGKCARRYCECAALFAEVKVKNLMLIGNVLMIEAMVEECGFYGPQAQNGWMC